MNSKHHIPFIQSSLPTLELYMSELRSVFDSHRLTSKGSKHERLEQELKTLLKVEYASLFVNGHLALESILEAYDLKGEIITTPFTFPSTTHAIVRTGSKPVFCDIKLTDFTIDETKVEALINKNTVAIMPVHVLGQVCNVKALADIAQKHQLKLIYDAAHVFGVEVDGVGIGNFGDASIFSMNATKVFHTIEGGLITHHEAKLTEKLELIKYYGITNNDVNYIGSNLKMNEFQAAMGLVNLPQFSSEVDKRLALIELYQAKLKDNPYVEVMKYSKSIKPNGIYFYILVKAGHRVRDALAKHLKNCGVDTKAYFSPLVPQLECYRDTASLTSLVNAQWMSERVLCLPLYSELSHEDLTYVVECMDSFFKQCNPKSLEV
jgi:dTDP-4-amino-4,6-dideoxygalactose transaminase